MKLSNLSRAEVEHILLYDGQDEEVEDEISEQMGINEIKEQIKMDKNQDVFDGTIPLSRYGEGLEDLGEGWLL